MEKIAAIAAAALVILAAGGVALLSGCAAGNVAIDAAALDRSMDRAEQVIERHASNLPDEDAQEVQDAFGVLKDAHAALRNPGADIAWHYDRARDAYTRLRMVAEKHWDQLAGYEQRWAKDLDRRAQRLDDSLGDRGAQLRDYIEIGAAAARLLIYVGAV